MNRKIIPFTTEEAWLEERKRYLTSSDIPCLFGCGYISEEELRHEKKKGQIQQFIKDERMDWGNALQDAIANEFARKNKWTIRKKTEFIVFPELRIGSSFDFSIEETALLEIKNIDQFIYKKEWLTNGFEIEASPYIEIQVQHQMLVSGLSVCYIGALVGGNKGVLLKREANPKIQNAILNKAEKFWRSL